MRRGWLVAISAVLSLLIAGAMLLAVSDCLRSCSQVELSQVLDVLAEKASNAAAAARMAESAGGSGSNGSAESNGSAGDNGGIGGNNSAGGDSGSGGTGSFGRTGSSGGTVRDPDFQDAAVPSVPCSAVEPLGDPCVRTLRDVPVRR